VARARASRLTRIDYWPGFVDAMATLLLVFVFLLSVFILAQFFLGQEVTSKDTVLARLNSQIAELTELLSLEKSGSRDLQETLATLQANLSEAESERSRLQGIIDSGSSAEGEAAGRIATLEGSLDSEKQVSQRALAQVELLNQQIAALRRQLSALGDALDASEARRKESQVQIADLGKRLNIALAQRVQELSQYRSDFFGRLRQILADRPDVEVVGDRFVLPASVLFSTASDDLGDQARVELDKIADAVLELEGQIPLEINWVIRVDGHTDVRPIQAATRFRSNWELSAARAIAVVRYMIERGIKPEHLVAAGFGEFQPLDSAETEDAYQRNRRIELKLTER
jgi:chemotaxis protein MotB